LPKKMKSLQGWIGDRDSELHVWACHSPGSALDAANGTEEAGA